MKISNKRHDSSCENEKNVQKSQKHEANLQKNTALYFQIGLIMCLLAAYGALEMRFESNDFKIPDTAKVEVEKEYMFAPNFKVEVNAVEASEPLKKQPVKIDKVKIVPDETPEEKTTLGKLESEVFTPLKPKGVKTPFDENALNVVEPKEEVHVNFVEMVPVYPGCESANSNDKRRKCMSEKLSKLVQKKFNRDLGAKLGLKEGIQRIYVNFRINKFGIVEIINTRAPHKALEKEANSVVGRVPQMKPGEQGGEPVSVLYSLPIVFEVRY
ncbi:hypothetical protein [Olleya sp. HaHaR_3_96]|uniref:hypothetical protein n=1 Tax=Olleya sp. HaHaR_3_96 TaxID=2745560 RepID=UPI001C4FE712|nr:hypothetical protein [Olleya sp. HaHaR_3_96]QXP60198.1 hypothetical protein H0I26_00710 [Olleya sp. HaHaR_3_96]